MGLGRVLFIVATIVFSSVYCDVPPACERIDQRLGCESDPEIRSNLLVEKAKIFYADQQRIEAQEIFLESLKLRPVHDTAAASEEEKKLFLSLLPEYEDSIQSKEGSERFSQQIKEQIAKHPSYASLEYYAAVSLANQGRMAEFFDRFSSAFGHRVDCFLRWKTVGVLHVRLYEGSANETRREYHRVEAVRWLKEAYSRQKEDSGLSVKILFVLHPSERGSFLREIAESVQTMNVPMRRGDCFALIAQAIELNEHTIAKQLIEKARTWYQYSKTLDELSERLCPSTQK